MSIRTVQAVLDNSPQKGGLKLLLMAIANSENEGTGRCDPGVSVLAFYCGITERNVRKSLFKLVAAGELVIEDRPGTSNQYYIPLYTAEPGYLIERCEQPAHYCCGEHGRIANRAELAMEANPRWQRRRAHKKKADTPVAGDRGNDAIPLSLATGGDVAGDRGDGRWRQGGTVAGDSQTRIEPEYEPEENRKASIAIKKNKPAERRPTPTYKQWVATLALGEQANYHVRPMIGHQNYRRWCFEHGMEPPE